MEQRIDVVAPPALAERAFFRRAAPYAEVVASLGATLGLTFGLAIVVLIPLMLALQLPPLSVEVPLEPRQGAASVATPQQLIHALLQEEVARGVEVVRDAGGERLVLAGLGSRVAAERAVLEVLASGGFDTRFEFRPHADAGALVEDLRVTIPMLIVQAFAFLLAGAVLIRFRVRGVRFGPGMGRLQSIAVGVSGGLVAVAAGTLVGAVLEWIGLPVSEQEVLVRLLSDPQKVLWLFPWVVVVAPLAEEVFFRGYVFRFLHGRAGAFAGYAVSGLLFAAVHLNLSGVPIYLVVGTVFALVYRHTSSLAAPIAAHLTYNGVLMLTVALFGV